MYNMLDIRDTLSSQVQVAPVQRTSGLMRKARIEIQEEPYNAATSMLEHIQKYQDSVRIEEGIDTQAMSEVEPSVYPETRPATLTPSTLAEEGDWIDTSSAVLRDFEGFKEEPYYDVNAFRAGYGSDTYTTESGEVKTVVEGSRVSREDAERDLRRRVQTEFGRRAAETAGDAWETYNPVQRAALVSIAYNYGSIPGRIESAVKSGDPQRVSEAILTLSGDNDSINKRRREKEAQMMLYRGGS